MPYRDDSQRPPFDVEAAARKIAEAKGTHDAFSDHVQKEGKFSDLNVKSREDYAKTITETVKAPDTECFHAGDGRAIFYRESNNIFVAYDPGREHGGSCYRPIDGRDSLERSFTKDVTFDNGSPDRSRILTGGYEALYSGRDPARVQPEQQSNSEPPEPTKPGTNRPPLREAEESASAAKPGPDLTKVDLPKYAEAEHGYTAKSHASGIYLEKDGERLRTQQDSEGSWSYENPRKDNDSGTITDFATRRGGSEAGITDYLNRNPDEVRKAQEVQKASEDTRAKAAEQAATRTPDGRGE